MEQKVVFITGASSGIGKVTANYLHKQGYIVYGGSRKPDKNGNDSYNPIKLDVTSDISVKQSVSTIHEKEGRIDVLINSAGYGIAGPIEETSIEEINSQLNTNYLGVIRLCKAVLPLMRMKRRGLIINMSSLGGVSSQPYQGHYCASKFALEGMSEALRMEVAEFGIKVVLIVAGNFNTNFKANRKITTGMSIDSDYHDRFINTLRVIENDETTGQDPLRIAQLTKDVIEKSAPRLRYTVGFYKEKLIVPLKRILPWSVYEYLIKKHYNFFNSFNP